MKNEQIKVEIEKVKNNKFLPENIKAIKIKQLEAQLTSRQSEEVTLLKTKIDPKYGQEIITVKKNKNGKWSVFSKSDAWKEREELPDGTDSEASAMKIAKELASYTKEFEQAKSKPGNKADWERSVIDAFADKNDMTNSDAQGVFDVHESAMNKAFDAGTSAKVAANQLEKISTKPKPAKKEKKELKPKIKTVHKYKGKAVNELNDMDCEELIKETQERRKKAAKAEKKSKSKPIIEKVTAPIVRAVKKAIENIPAADLKDKPGTELTRIDKAIAATKRFMMELKTILGDDFDKDTVEDEIKDLHALAKELHQKYGDVKNDTKPDKKQDQSDEGEEDTLPNDVEEQVKLGKVTYRGTGMNSKHFGMYKLKVHGREYLVSLKTLRSFEQNGKKIPFKAPERKGL